jgi:predicted metal-dependent phosphoesterase TrpH
MAERMLRMDMHLHTGASFDCLCAPEAVLEAALRRGMDRIVVTDHNEIDAALELNRAHPEHVLVGEEVKTAEGVDVIGILLRERIPRDTPAVEVCRAIREQGGVVYLPHPFDLHRSGAGEFVDVLEPWIDVVEVHNARSTARRNARAEAWAAERGFLAGAGSDAHSLREVGRGFVEVPAFAPNREGLLDALRGGRVVGRVTSSYLVHLASTYAKLRKALPGAWTVPRPLR